MRPTYKMLVYSDAGIPYWNAGGMTKREALERRRLWISRYPTDTHKPTVHKEDLPCA